MANVDLVVERTEKEVVTKWAQKEEAAGHLSAAVGLFADLADSKGLVAAISRELRGWANTASPTSKWSRSLLEVGAAFNSGLVAIDGLSDRASSVLKLCAGMADVAGGGSAHEAAEVAVRAADAGEGKVALLFCDLAIDLAPATFSDDRAALLLELHAAAASANAVLQASSVEGACAETTLVAHVLGRLHNLPQK